MDHVGHEPACFSCGEWAQLAACTALVPCRSVPPCLLLSGLPAYYHPTSPPTWPPADLAVKQQVAEFVKQCLEKPYRAKAITKEEYK